MKEPPFLLAMQRIVGRIEVKNDLPRARSCDARGASFGARVARFWVARAGRPAPPRQGRHRVIEPTPSAGTRPRGAPPEHLPRVHVTIEPESTVCPCCHGAMPAGLPVDRSTLAFWVGVAAAELKPIYLRMKELLLGRFLRGLRKLIFQTCHRTRRNAHTGF
jgi:hypothetical protein